jgi:hypothetical protein
MSQYDVIVSQNIAASGKEYVSRPVNIGKGALLSADAGFVPAVLDAGTDGYILARDDTETTGLKWIPPFVDTNYYLSAVNVISIDNVDFILSGGGPNITGIDFSHTHVYQNDVLKWDIDKYTPYTVQTPGAFDVSVTDPVHSFRLNYNGTFYASQFHSTNYFRVGSGDNQFTTTVNSLNVTIGGTTRTSLNPSEADSGSAVAYMFDTSNNLTSSTAKLVQVRNFGTEKFYINKDGDVYAGGVLLTGAPSGAALTSTNDTNITLTLGGTPSTALLQATSMTMGWTGTLADSRIASSGNWNTAYGWGDHAGLYYTKTESDDKYLLNITDTLTGDLTITGGLTVDTDTLVVDDVNNRVGIGTASPLDNLHIRNGATTGYTPSGVSTVTVEDINGGSIALLSGSSGTSYLIFGDDTDNKGYLKYDHSNDAMTLRANGTSNQLVLNSTGNVGIGTPDPGAYKLNVNGDTNISGGLVVDTDSLVVDDVTGAVTMAGDVSANNLSGTNTGDQTSIVGITGTIAQFNTALTDGDFATGGGTATGTNTGDQDLSGLVPYTGATANVNLGVYDLLATDLSASAKLYVDSINEYTTSAGIILEHETTIKNASGGYLNLRRFDGIIGTGEILGVISFTGDDDSLRTGAKIVATASQGWSSGGPSKLEFYTDNFGGTGLSSPRMTIADDGDIEVASKITAVGSVQGSIIRASGAATSGVGLLESVITSADTFGTAEIIKLTSDAASANDGVSVGFHAKDSSAGSDQYAEIKMIIVDSTSGSEDGQVSLSAMVAGSLTSLFYVNGVNAVISSTNLFVPATTFSADITNTTTYGNTTGSSANMYVGSDGVYKRSTASTIRVKENIELWRESGLDIINKLQPKTFNYKKSHYKYNRNFLGLIAEDVKDVSEYLVDFENEDGTGKVENVNYARIVVPLIKAVQEQQKEIDRLKKLLN